MKKRMFYIFSAGSNFLDAFKINTDIVQIQPSVSGVQACLIVQVCCSGVVIVSQKQDFLCAALQRQVRWGHFPTEQVETGGEIILFSKKKGLYLSFSLN